MENYIKHFDEYIFSIYSYFNHFVLLLNVHEIINQEIKNDILQSIVF